MEQEKELLVWEKYAWIRILLLPLASGLLLLLLR